MNELRNLVSWRDQRFLVADSNCCLWVPNLSSSYESCIIVSRGNQSRMVVALRSAPSQSKNVA